VYVVVWDEVEVEVVWSGSCAKKLWSCGVAVVRATVVGEVRSTRRAER
jgi:hypothetical protein